MSAAAHAKSMAHLPNRVVSQSSNTIQDIIRACERYEVKVSVVDAQARRWLSSERKGIGCIIVDSSLKTLIHCLHDSDCISQYQQHQLYACTKAFTCKLSTYL